MGTTVVNIKAGEPYDVYIGRAMPRYGLPASPYANPFRIVPGERDRKDVITAYFIWVHESKDPAAVYIREHVHELRGKRLGCWCHPAPCHGSVLAQMADQAQEGGEGCS